MGSGRRRGGHRLRSRPCWPASPAAAAGAYAGEDGQDRAPGGRALPVFLEAQGGPSMQ